jgi:hypothetical protein
MKICVIIYGLKRCINLVIGNIDNLLNGHEIDYIICLSDNTNEKESEYINNIDLNILDKSNTIKKLFYRYRPEEFKI